MLRLVTEILLNHINYQILEYDDIGNYWAALANNYIEQDNVVNILFCLQDLPVHLREDIFNRYIISSFQEWFFIEQIDNDIEIIFQNELEKIFQDEVDNLLIFINQLNQIGVYFEAESIMMMIDNIRHEL